MGKDALLQNSQHLLGSTVMTKHQANLWIGNVLLEAQKDNVALPKSALSGNPYEAWLKENKRSQRLSKSVIGGFLCMLFAGVFFISSKSTEVSSVMVCSFALLLVAVALIYGLAQFLEWDTSYDHATYGLAKLWKDNCRKFEQVNLPWFLTTMSHVLPTADIERRSRLLEHFGILAQRIMSLIIASEFEPKDLFKTLKNPPNASGPGHVEFELTEDMRQRAYSMMEVIEKLVVLFRISNKPKEWRHSLHQNILHLVFIPGSKEMNPCIILHPEVLHGDVDVTE